jgi:hypothetical protein
MKKLMGASNEVVQLASDAEARLVSAWDEAVQFAGTARTKSATDNATAGIRAALVSMGGATFGATAIGVTLTIFFFQQNIQRLQYRTSKTTLRDQRIINFAAVTISLAIADYALAAIVTPQNAYAICGAGVMFAVLFGCTIVWFFKSILELLDLQVSIDEIFRNYANNLHSKLLAFGPFISDLERTVIDLETTSIHQIGHAAEHKFLNCVKPIAELADGCVEELTQIVLVLVRQGDYKVADVACQQIANTCVGAILQIDYMFIRFQETVKSNFTNRSNFRDTFARVLQIARYAGTNSDVSLYKILVPMYSKIARSIAPGATAQSFGRKVSSANTVNAVEALHNIRDAALIGCRDEFSEASVICLNALLELVDSWGERHSFFCSIYAEIIHNIAIASLGNRNGDFAAERALECMVALVKPIWNSGLDVRDLQEVFQHVSTIVKAIAARYPTGNPTPKYPISFDVAIRTNHRLYEEQQTVFKIMEEVCIDIQQDPRVDGLNLTRLVAFLDAYLSFLLSVGYTIFGSDLPGRLDVVATTCKCLELCMVLRQKLLDLGLPRGDANVTSLDELVRRRVGSLSNDVNKFYGDNLGLGSLWLTFYLDNLALLAAEQGDDDLVAEIVKVCLQQARELLARNVNRDVQTGRCIYLAVIIGALDKGNRSLDAITDAIRFGLWAEFSARFPEAASEVRKAVEIADEKVLLGQKPPYNSSASKRIVEMVTFGRIRDFQSAVLRVMDSSPGKEILEGRTSP